MTVRVEESVSPAVNVDVDADSIPLPLPGGAVNADRRERRQGRYGKTRTRSIPTHSGLGTGKSIPNSTSPSPFVSLLSPRSYSTSQTIAPAEFRKGKKKVLLLGSGMVSLPFITCLLSSSSSAATSNIQLIIGLSIHYYRMGS